MPTSAQLRAEILDGPLKTEIAPFWSPVTDDTDTEVAKILNRKDLPGYVPARTLIAYLAEHLLWDMVPLCHDHLKLPNGSDAPLEVYKLFAALHLAAYGTVNPPLRMAVGPLTVAMTSLIRLNLITSDDRAAILAMEVKVSRAEQVWGYDTAITPRQIFDVRIEGQ